MSPIRRFYLIYLYMIYLMIFERKILYISMRNRYKIFFHDKKLKTSETCKSYFKEFAAMREKEIIV